MRPPLTTVEQAAAAAYLMKHAGATALLVLDGHTDQPIGIITQADITRAVADGKDVNRVRIYDLMTTRPTVISTHTTGMAGPHLGPARRARVGAVDLTERGKRGAGGVWPEADDFPDLCLARA
jgi:CBS domain-containing protein